MAMASLLKIRGQLPWSTSPLNVLLKPQHPATVRLLTTCHRYSMRGQRSCLYRGATAATTMAEPMLGSACPPALWSHLRCASTKVIDGDTVEPKQQVSWFRQFWRWLHDMDDLDRWDNPPTNQEELDEREVFLNRVQEMYFANPPIKPDLQFCRESLEMLMKYNDRVAVETLWNILPELKVEPDDELRARVEAYMKKARQEAYYE